MTPAEKNEITPTWHSVERPTLLSGPDPTRTTTNLASVTAANLRHDCYQAMKKPPRRNIRIPGEHRPKKPSSGQVRDFHPSRIAPERLEAFREAYIQTKGNAARAARAIGMSPALAKSEAWRLVKALNVRVADALEMLGIDAVSQAKKLLFLREATMPKWNAGTEDWDIFLDSSTQLEATKEINRLRDEYPAKKEPAPAQGPVTVIFSTNIEVYKDKTLGQDPTKILEQGQPERPDTSD